MGSRARARLLAAEYNRRGDAMGWFEPLYREASEGRASVPWLDLKPNPNLLRALEGGPLKAESGARALVVGCGAGDDAEELSRRGFRTTAFDISATAIKLCRERFPATCVEYVVADLFAAPAVWAEAFDFVLESYTLQVLPPAVRAAALDRIAGFVRPEGHLIVITRGRDATDPAGEMPWPLTRDEFDRLEDLNLREELFEDYLDSEGPPVRRFCVQYRRHA